MPPYYSSSSYYYHYCSKGRWGGGPKNKTLNPGPGPGCVYHTRGLDHTKSKKSNG